MGRGKIVEVSGVVECFKPVRLGEICIGKHCTSPVEKHPVKALSDSIMLGCIWSCDFMLDPALVEVVFDVAGYVLTSPIRAEYLNLCAHFQFCL